MLSIEMLIVTILSVLNAEASYEYCFATCQNAEFRLSVIMQSTTYTEYRNADSPNAEQLFTDCHLC
jgi:hypothetical protein